MIVAIKLNAYSSIRHYFEWIWVFWQIAEAKGVVSIIVDFRLVYSHFMASGLVGWTGQTPFQRSFKYIRFAL